MTAAALSGAMILIGWHKPAWCRVAVLNDFEANGYGVPALAPEDLIVLNDVPPAPKVLPKLYTLNTDRLSMKGAA